MQNEHDGRGDFDFFIGRWKAHNHRLRERLKGSTEWEDIEGVAVIRKLKSYSKAGRYSSVLFVVTLRSHPADGNRHFLPMVARPGKRIGSRN